MTQQAEKAREAASAFMDFVNNMSHDADAFAGTVARDHRTLQSQAVSLMLRTIYEVAKNDTDARNESAVAKCKQIVELLGDRGYMVPFI